MIRLIESLKKWNNERVRQKTKKDILDRIDMARVLFDASEAGDYWDLKYGGNLLDRARDSYSQLGVKVPEIEEKFNKVMRNYPGKGFSGEFIV